MPAARRSRLANVSSHMTYSPVRLLGMKAMRSSAAPICCSDGSRRSDGFSMWRSLLAIV